MLNIRLCYWRFVLKEASLLSYFFLFEATGKIVETLQISREKSSSSTLFRILNPNKEPFRHIKTPFEHVPRAWLASILCHQFKYTKSGRKWSTRKEWGVYVLIDAGVNINLQRFTCRYGKCIPSLIFFYKQMQNKIITTDRINSGGYETTNKNDSNLLSGF